MLCLGVVSGVFAPFDRSVTHAVGGFSCLFLLRVVNGQWSLVMVMAAEVEVSLIVPLDSTGCVWGIGGFEAL